MRLRKQVLWTLVIGFFLASLISKYSWELEKDKWFEKFSVEVDKEMLSFTAYFEINGRILIGIRSFFEGSSRVSRKEFNTYTRPIFDNYKFIQALEWIPRVPATQRKIFEENTRKKGFPDFVITEKTPLGKMIKAGSRPEYFPVLYLEPMKGNEEAFGYDLGSNFTRLETLKLSRDSGQPVASQKVNLVQGEQHHAGILIFVPLYEKGATPKTITERREKLLGFILGVYNVNKMINNILASMPEAGMNLAVFHDKEISEKNKLFGNRANNPPLEIIKHYDFYGHMWSFVWQGSDKFFQGFNRGPAVLWFIGISVSTIFMAIIFNLVLIRRDSEKKLESILNSAGEGIYGLDMNGLTTFVNASAERMLGYSLKEMSHQSQHDLIHHSKADGTPYPRKDCHIYAALQDGETHRSSEEVFWKKDGTSFPVEYLSTPVIKDDKVVGAVVTFKDISERKKSEDLAIRFGRILDNSSNEIYVFDASTFRFSQVNSGARENLGYSIEELAHLTPLEIKPNYTIETFEKLINPLRLRQKSVVLFQTVHKRKNGTLYPVEVKLQLMHEETPPVFIATIQDITVRKKAEEELQKHREHLEELVEERTAELTKANEQLRELDHLKSMFMASMSHELRTPLNSIIGFTSVLLQELPGRINPKQKDYLGRAHQSSKHLLGLISDIMDISKIESGTIEAVLELFNMGKVVADAVDSVDALKMKSKGIELKIEVPHDLEIYSDRKRLLQCLINLLSNAAKFTESGSIRVTAREVGGDIEVMVEDTGIGIAETDLPKLFRQFERLDSPLKVKAGGTGLGLYLTRKLATEILGGSVWVESQLDVGSKFFFKFPKNLKLQKSK